MGFNLKSGNSALAFKEMGATPAKMDASMLSGAADSGGGGGFDLSKATTTDAKGMTENVDKSKQSPAGDDKPKEEKKPSNKKSSGGGSKGPNVGPPPTIAGGQLS